MAYFEFAKSRQPLIFAFSAETNEVDVKKDLARPNLAAITGLRFFLAFAVVAFHASGADGTLRLDSLSVPIVLAHVITSGYAAVGFFYLLSGFVLAYGYDLHEGWSTGQWRRFMLARAARIYPVYALALIVSLPVAIVVMSKEPGHSITENIATIVTTPLLLQAWLPDSSSVWNGPGWSLSAEAFFYVLFPIVGVMLWRAKALRVVIPLAVVIWLLSLVITALTSLHFAQDLWSTSATAEPIRDSWNAAVKFNPLFHVSTFFVGILTARLYLHLNASNGLLRPGRGAWLYLPGIAIEIFVAAHADRLPYPLLHDGLLVPLHAAIVLGLALGGGGLQRLLGTPKFVFLGQSSYALYLLHVPIDRFWVIGAKHLLHRQMFGVAWFFVYVGICISISCLVFVLVEEPMRRTIVRRFGTETRFHLSHR